MKYGGIGLDLGFFAPVHWVGGQLGFSLGLEFCGAWIMETYRHTQVNLSTNPISGSLELA